MKSWEPGAAYCVPSHACSFACVQLDLLVARKEVNHAHLERRIEDRPVAIAGPEPDAYGAVGKLVDGGRRDQRWTRLPVDAIVLHVAAAADTHDLVKARWRQVVGVGT